MPNAAARRVARGPALARARVRRVPVRAQRATVEPRIRHGVHDLFARAAKELRRDRRARDPDEQHVIEADAIEARAQREHALNLVRLDHRGEHVADRERSHAGATPAAAQIVRDREYRAEVVRRMSPLGREPGVVEVEPADHRADVERRGDRIELEARARHARSARQLSPGHERPEQLRARGVVEREDSAAERVHQAIARNAPRLATVCAKFAHVVRDLREQLVGWRSVCVAVDRGHSPLPASSVPGSI